MSLRSIIRPSARILCLAVCFFATALSAAEYQWSVPVPDQPAARAFLWIPPDCPQIRAVVVGQHNMVEEHILEHPEFRAALAKLGMAGIWIAPPVEMVFDFNKGAGEHFEAILRALAAESGYEELALAPVVPIGHSACASYPWNFAAWNPGRTLAILSIHGDAPLTKLTGSGRPNPDWGDRNIDGIPGLMVMAEYEWSDDRLIPALEFRARHPQTPLAMLAEPGRGHFDVSDELIRYLSMFLRKAAEQRLPAVTAPGEAPVLRPVDPGQGWLVGRWYLHQQRKTTPAPVAKYAGDPREAFWSLDEEMAAATQNYLAGQTGKKPQLLGYVQEGKTLPQEDIHQQVTIPFAPLNDGITFRLTGVFLDTVESGCKNLSRWTGLPVGTPLGHAAGGGPIILSRITGPVTQTGPDTFAVSLNRSNSTADKRNLDIWLLASHPGDAEYKSAVQQAMLRLQPNTEGRDQRITFPKIPDQKSGAAPLELQATSDSGLPVSYYVREGPAEVVGNRLKFSAIPPRAKFPIPVTVVAWQWGNRPKTKTAQPVTQTFSILP